MNTSTTPTPHPLAGKALTKLRVFWAVQTGSSEYMDFWGFSTSGRYTVKDAKAYGTRYLKQHADKLGTTITRAIIYDRELGGEICRKENGIWTK